VQALQAQLQHHMGAGTSHDSHVQQPQQQPPWQYHQDSHSNSNTVLQAVPEETAAHASSGRSQPWPAQQQLVAPATNRAVQVQHVSSSSSSATPGHQPACNLSQPPPQQQQGLDEGYCLQLMTVERCSRLWFHLHRAWVGAHMRAALAAAGAPGDTAGWEGWDIDFWRCTSSCGLGLEGRHVAAGCCAWHVLACSSRTSRCWHQPRHRH
jgi:hypothetical protein